MPKQLTLAEIRKRIEKIATEDDESAHCSEDRLYADVLRWFAEVAPAELGEMARLVLTTKELNFSRWYA